jgi:hypothetical protein
MSLLALQQPRPTHESSTKILLLPTPSMRLPPLRLIRISRHFPAILSFRIGMLTPPQPLLSHYLRISDTLPIYMEDSPRTKLYIPRFRIGSLPKFSTQASPILITTNTTQTCRSLLIIVPNFSFPPSRIPSFLHFLSFSSLSFLSAL